MARKAREKSSTGVYAIILRSNEKVFAKKKMREAFLDAAQGYLDKGLMGIRFYDTYVHMLVRESAMGISLDMKPLITSFARTYNRENETEGKVFADRFKSVPVETKELEAECLAYLDGGAKSAAYTAAAVPVRAEEKKPRRQPVEKSAPVKAKPAKQSAPVKAKPAKKSAPVEIKPVKEPAPVKAEPAPETVKPKKNRSLPSWLL